MAPRYRHTQTGWVIIVSAVIVLLVGGIPLVASSYAPGWILIGAIVAFLLAGFGAMTITVDERSIEARLGVGIIRKRVQLSDIRSFRLVNNPWYYGWGIRLIPGGTLYNVSGTGAVEFLLTSGKRLRFGSDEPEALFRAIEAVKGRPEPLTPAEEKRLRSGTLRYVLISAGIGIAIIAAVVALVVLETRAPRVELSNDKLSVSSTIYGVEVPLRDITSVTLEHRLPRIRLRTNGFALGGTLRGHFRVDQLGDGQLFIEAGNPPYLLVRTQSGYVVVNFADSSRTLELHTRLTEAREAKSDR